VFVRDVSLSFLLGPIQAISHTNFPVITQLVQLELLSPLKA